MPTLHIEHPITDLTTWMSGPSKPPPTRGMRSACVPNTCATPFGDLTSIVVDLDFDTAEQAETFLEFLRTHIWAVPERSPALAGTPETMILEDVTLPGRQEDGTGTAWLTIVNWPGGTLDTFDALEASHGDNEHTGLVARYCSQQPDALRIVAVWKSEEHADRFFEHLPDANRARLAPAGIASVAAFAAQRTYRTT